MPLFDRKCPTCGSITIDCYEPSTPPTVFCACGGTMDRVWLNHAPGVIPDDIPGGVEIKHGLCAADGSPRRYYSKSEIAKEAKKRGLTNFVTHQGGLGTDKAPNGHTTRWY